MSGRVLALQPGAVVLEGDAVLAALQAVLAAQRARAARGLPSSRAWEVLAAELSRCPDADNATGPVSESGPADAPMVPSAEAAHILGCSPRTVRRLAPKLGGQLVAGRWLVDRDAVLEHIAGAKKEKERT